MVLTRFSGGQRPRRKVTGRPLKSQVAGLVIGGQFAFHLSAVPNGSRRAYVIKPTGSNAVTLIYTFSDGTVLFEGAVPIADFRVQISTPVISYCPAHGLFGHSANITASAPYGVGNLSGKVARAQEST